MNNNYSNDPTPSAKVILFTTFGSSFLLGQLQIQLWAKQTPKTTRNFLQHLLNGYYDNSIFHRVIPNFMIEGGDPTGTGQGGKSIYGKPFKDQFHPNLKFQFRGILAMSNNSRPNNNNSQFFITFAECVRLNKKHTIFGKVIGNTIYNLLSVQSIDVDQNDKPIDPPVLIKGKIIVNPFDDLLIIKKSNEQIIRQKVQEELQRKRSKQEIIKKKINNKNLLSFQDQQELKVEKSKNILSSHDTLNDKKLSKMVAITQEQLHWKKKIKQIEDEKKKQMKNKIYNTQQPSKQLNTIKNQMVQKIYKYQNQSKFYENEEENQLNNFKTKFNQKTKQKQIYWENQPQIKQSQSQSNSSQSQEIQNQELRLIRQQQKQEIIKLKTDELVFKKIKQGTTKKQENKKNILQSNLNSNLQKRRFKFIKQQRQSNFQKPAFIKLQQLKKQLNSDQNKWFNHKLKFHIDSANAFKHKENQNKIHSTFVVDTCQQKMSNINPEKQLNQELENKKHKY